MILNFYQVAVLKKFGLVLILCLVYCLFLVCNIV